MKVLIIGSGGREHAIAWSVSRSPKVDKIYCAPGNAGIEEVAECVPIGAMEFDKLVAFAKEKAIEQFTGLFLDLQLKALNSEISTKALDLRGLLAAMKIIKVGLSPSLAVQMGIVNKTFDVFEKEIVEDVVHTRIPAEWIREDVYE